MRGIVAQASGWSDADHLPGSLLQWVVFANSSFLSVNAGDEAS